MAEPRLDFIVVGGGMAGLVTARALLARGRTGLLLEASERWGGVVRTVREGGFLFDAGPDSMLAQKPEGVALCRELGLGDRLLPTNASQRTVYVLHRGRLHAMPDGMVLGVPTRLWPLAFSGLFTWRGKMRMAMEPFVPRRREAGDESIAAFFARRLGREAVERLGEPLLGGIHAGDPGELSILSTFPRLPEMEQRSGSLTRGMRTAARHSAGTAFVSLRDGMGELVDALVASIPETSRRLRAPVCRITRDGNDVVVEADSGAWRARAVVLAVPPPRSSRLLASVQPEVAALLGGVAFASTATVVAGYRRADVAHPLDGYGLVVPRTEGTRTLACTFVSTKLAGRAPEGHVLLRGFVGGRRDPAVLERDDDTLSRSVLGEMEPVLGLRGAPAFVRVFRWPQATPQMAVGHAERVAALDAPSAAVPGIFLTGAGLRVAGIPDVIADALKTAENVTHYIETRSR